MPNEPTSRAFKVNFLYVLSSTAAPLKLELPIHGKISFLCDLITRSDRNINYDIGDSRSILSTAVDQAVACAPVTQWAWVQSPVGTSFPDEVFRVFSSPIRQMSGSFRPTRSPNIIWPSLSSSIIIRYRRQ